MIQAILFDFDGTIGNTNQLIFDSFKHTFLAHKIDYTEKDIMEAFGPTLRQTFTKYGNSEEEILEMIQTYRTFNLANHDKYIESFPDVRVTLEEIKKRGYKIGIVTSKLTDLATHGTKMIDVYDLIDVIVGASEVQKPKPDPEGVFLAMKLLNVDSAMLVGDNPSDIYSAKNANILSCGVTWSVKLDELEESKPDYMISSMKELIDIIGDDSNV